MRVHKLSPTPIVLAVLLVVSGCTVGSGDSVTESRQVDEFEEIVLQTSGDVDVSVTGEVSVRVEADDNILPILTTDVANGTLELGSSESFTSTSRIRYTITVRELEAVTITGSGDFNIEGIDTDSFSAEIAGSGSIEPSGFSRELDVLISGSGSFRGDDLESDTGSVTISGSGSAIVNVVDRLDARIDGSGSIEYIGDPLVDERIGGSGSVSRR